MDFLFSPRCVAMLAFSPALRIGYWIAFPILCSVLLSCFSAWADVTPIVPAIVIVNAAAMPPINSFFIVSPYLPSRYGSPTVMGAQ